MRERAINWRAHTARLAASRKLNAATAVMITAAINALPRAIRNTVHGSESINPS
jgi:hypothetical protein